MNPPIEKQRRWHHSPLHVFEPGTAYIVTAGTFKKEHFFKSDERCAALQSSLLNLAEKYGWNLQAWAVFSNHYHWIGVSPDKADGLKKFISHLHTETAGHINKADGAPGRKVWFEYWDTCLTFENSYYARLNYVHNNPVKHGLVEIASLYPFCSAGWFEAHAEDGLIKKLRSYGHENVKVKDDF